MSIFEKDRKRLKGPRGELKVLEGDEITLKLAMLYAGECEIGPGAAAQLFGFSRQRYYQLLNAYREKGAAGLINRKRGPKTNYRRTPSVVRQVIRYRFLDPDASADVIAQRLRQTGWEIGARSVERIINEYGLQKKTPQIQT
jgi:transposase